MPDGGRYIAGYTLADVAYGHSKETLGDPHSNLRGSIKPIWKIFGDGWVNSAMADDMPSLMAELAAQNARLGRKLTWAKGKIDAQGRPTMTWKLRYPDGRTTWGDVRRARGPGLVEGEAPKVRPPEHRHRDNAKIVDAYKAGDESVAKIAKRFGVSSRTVYVLVEEAGVPKRGQFSGAQGKPGREKEESMSQIASMTREERDAIQDHLDRMHMRAREEFAKAVGGMRAESPVQRDEAAPATQAHKNR